MATLDRAEELLQQLRAAAYDGGKRDLEDIRAFAAEQGCEGELAHWDVSYWAERLKEARYAISDEVLRPYFALPNVLEVRGRDVEVHAVRLHTAQQHLELERARVARFHDCDLRIACAAGAVCARWSPVWRHHRGRGWHGPCVARGRALLPLAQGRQAQGGCEQACTHRAGGVPTLRVGGATTRA